MFRKSLLDFSWLPWAVGGSLCNRRPATRATCDCEESERQRVLVVGAGLTGCLVSNLLRRQGPPGLEIEVWERATYPSGRFGATFSFEKKPLRNGGRSDGTGNWVDLGAQVLSAVEVGSGHPNAGATGHNVSASDVAACWREVQGMVDEGLLERVPEEMLAETEERMKYEGLWAHFWCRWGLGYLLRRYISQASAHLRLGVRAEAIAFERGGQVTVRGSARGCGGASSMQAQADVVILAVPAPDAVKVVQLPRHVANTISGIEYDSRTAVAIFFDPVLQEPVARAFQGLAEVSLDIHSKEEVHLVSWQNAKDKSFAHGDIVRLVVHSAEGVSLNGPGPALEALSVMLGLSAALLEHLLLDWKVVDWKVCQMVRPFESLQTDLELELSEPALRVSGSPIILAGDYWCQSSFLGCFCSASAAVRQALASLRRCPPETSSRRNTCSTDGHL
ncbi:RNLS [Symbiodinium sp. CCMP2592]|nr:RNLS [Symbiodinium sp. CCMP2592]